MIRVPPRAIAARPASQPDVTSRNPSPIVISPCSPNAMPASESMSEGGNALRRSSILRLIHAVGRIALRQRAIVVLPELDEPLRTMT